MTVSFNSTDNYPVILYPNKVLHPFIFGEPSPPKAPSEKDLFGEAVGRAIEFAIGSGVISLPALAIGAAVVGIPGLAIAATVTGLALAAGAFAGYEEANEYNRVKYPQEKKTYENKRRKYEKDLRDFEINKPELSKRAVIDALRDTETYDGVGGNAKKGPSEDFFYPYLRARFGDKIKRSVKVVLYQDFPYVTDFTYHDLAKNLHIDIEIDEPYTLRDKLPIHSKYCNKESVRNAHFNSRGWVVVRFAEEQVVKQPQECCDLIAAIAEKLSGGYVEFPTNRVRAVPRWDDLDAQDMADTDYRLTYLPRTSRC
ncbi:MAG: hypothetical protein N5P05_004219 (plasmid) [Chroococcopsis gigantea SAG 12.99]|jgi:hypothetical protein|nr:hypothetical protein [Chroococcopsis gigantea SAG 12.99]